MEISGNDGPRAASVDERLVRQIEAAGARYRAAEADRGEIERRRAAGSRFPDEDDRLQLRAARLVEQHEVPGQVLLATSPDESAPRLAERIIGVTNDLQSLNFLARGLRAAACVARIWYSTGGPVRPQATGFLVAPSLLLTNHHVFPDAATARGAFAEFGAEMGVDNDLPVHTTRFAPDPDTLFLTDEDLDFSLVAMRPGGDGRPPGRIFGHIGLIAAEGKLVVGDPVNVIGHPDGRLKEIAIRANRFTQRLDDFLHYETDTEPGNSGSPVFNDQWEAVALHHSGVPAHDDSGAALNLQGLPWRPEQGLAQIEWVANEGVRISVILARLSALATGDDRLRTLLAELGAGSGLGTTPAARTAVPSPRSPVEPASGAEAVTVSGVSGRPGAFGSRVRLVFLHGRSQQGHDPAALRRSWAAGLNSGLTMAGLPTVDPEDVWFPFYGDRLVEVMESAAPIEAPLSPSAQGLYDELLGEAARRAGMPAPGQGVVTESIWDHVVGTVHEPLGWIAAHTGVDRLVIRAAFRDVAAYLDRDDTREAVLERVLAGLPGSGPVVLVAHSLGTVVAMDLLTRLGPAVPVAGLITAGAPLGMDAVYSRLRVGGAHLPPIAGPWFNAWCPTDPVAIGCPLADDWSGLAAECTVANPHDRAHDIGAYLAHREVATAIGRLLE
ncbi:serine protease [Embleya sp. NBC_00888]|uniref:trypsin-like peptidase domain-containing protein n=1 Tax=Embleya sp. NBC_00888 TaxID=2975960 RepID=UPI0038675AFE|nr:serine protease [Embleya sp. NBC_00888]